MKKRAELSYGPGAIGLTAVIALAASMAGYAGRASDSVPYSTPEGITLIDVTKIYDSSTDQFMWRRLGDENAKPLYTFDQDMKSGKSACTDECAKEFPPFVADKQAKPSGDWSLVSRDKGVKQWAYQGKPLYRYSGEDPDGAPVAGSTATAVAENPEWRDPGSKIYSPKTGWKRAAFTPEKTMTVPSGIALQSLAIANGFGFVDAMTGRTIYAAPASKKLSSDWMPVYAPGLGLPVGDFSIVGRADGTRQWAYRKQNLYTFRGDYSAGDASGMFGEKGLQAALVYRNFHPSNIVINVLPGRGPLMMTADGKSVYTQARYNLQYGGRETRTGYSIPYNFAKAVGTRGCVDECTQRWIPVAAPNDSQASGFWEVAMRADGTRQWAYKGSPLYTYVDDKEPGDIGGNNRHVIVYGDPEGKVSLAVTAGNNAGASRAMQAGSGFYWHLASLFY